MPSDLPELESLADVPHRFGPSFVELGRALEAAGDRRPGETEWDHERRFLEALPRHYTMREISAALADPWRIRYC